MFFSSRAAIWCLLSLLCLTNLKTAFAQQWSGASPSRSRVGGGISVTVQGVGFSTTPGNSYRCKFTANGQTEQSTLVAAQDANTVVCVTPQWTHGNADSILGIVDQANLPVPKQGGGTLTFQFRAPQLSVPASINYVMQNCNETANAMTFHANVSHAIETISLELKNVTSSLPGLVVNAPSASNAHSIQLSWFPDLSLPWNVSTSIVIVIGESGQAEPDLATMTVPINVEAPPEMIAPSPQHGQEFVVPVGETLNIILAAEDRNPSQAVLIALLEDPGLPSGSSITATGPYLEARRPGFGSLSTPVKRELSFRPSRGQQGFSYQICMFAYNSDSAVRPSRSCTRCIVVRVPPAVPSFDETLSTPADAVVPSAVQCETVIDIAIKDIGGAGYCASPVAVVSQGQTRALPQFAALEGVPGRSVATSVVSGCGNGTHYKIVWRPKRGQEGQQYRVCVDLVSHLQPDVQGIQRCYTIRVDKCLFCAAQGDSFTTAARLFGTDWVQLWGANPQHNDPDLLTDDGRRYTVGPTYLVQDGDTAAGIASRFGMPQEALLDLNPDLQSLDAVKLGDSLCITPHVCNDAGSQ